jgi:hypothetical protein
MKFSTTIALTLASIAFANPLNQIGSPAKARGADDNCNGSIGNCYDNDCNGNEFSLFCLTVSLLSILLPHIPCAGEFI